MSLAETRCRSCDKGPLVPVLSLGRTPLANSLLTADDLSKPEPSYPLDLAFCESCSLVQITETVPPETLFREYLYFSSFSDTMLKHAESIVNRMIESERLGPESLAMEIASNDGYLLQYYARRSIPVLGIEPAINIARVATERGIRTISEFFGRELAPKLEPADVVHANNVLAHVPDLNGFVAGIQRVLKKRGVAVIEAPYVRDLIEHCEFDTIYHEHLCYFSLTALDALFARHGLVIRNVERTPMHGGSLRIFVANPGPGVDPSVAKVLAEEASWGVRDRRVYLAFAGRVERLKAELREHLAALKRAGKRIAAYGAAAKGTTLLNYFGIGRDVLDFVVDRSTHKQGRYMPGVHLPIYAPAKLLEARPDEVLLLTWNFADEILEQQSEYRKLGGRFIVPVPEVRTL